MSCENIIPSELRKELAKATKDGNIERKQNVMNQIRPVVEEYVASIRKPELPSQGEQILWLHTVTKGIFKKEILERWIITNLRAVYSVAIEKKYVQSGQAQEVNMNGKVVGLAVCDTVVMNQHRISQGSRVGNFVGTGGRGFVGTGFSSSSSTSSTYGDLVFITQGKEAFRFRGISDPNGVHRMIETLKKQQAP